MLPVSTPNKCCKSPRIFKRSIWKHVGAAVAARPFLRPHPGLQVKVGGEIGSRTQHVSHSVALNAQVDRLVLQVLVPKTSDPTVGLFSPVLRIQCSAKSLCFYPLRGWLDLNQLHIVLKTIALPDELHVSPEVRGTGEILIRVRCRCQL